MAKLLDHLAARFPAARRTTLRRMLAEGRVRINGRVIRSAAAEVPADAAVEVADRPAAPAPAPAPAPPAGRGKRRGTVAADVAVIYEDPDLLVVNKPPGLLTSTTAREKRPTLLKRVREHVARVDPRARVGLIHRLDRDAAGLLVFSKSDEAYESLKSQFYHHRVERVYLAVVQGRPQPPRGRIESRLVELADGRVVRTRRPGKGQRAVLEYQVLEALPGRALVRVTLQTGRKHQIRAQLSGRGWPIAGDATYGAKPAAGGLHLCAVRLGFTHPRTGEAVSWEIPPHFRW